MIPSRLLNRLFTVALAASGVLSAQPRQADRKLADNAALRYWSAFAQMRDSSISPEQAKEIQAILEGKQPYSDAKNKDLVERNRGAVETLLRGAALSECDWALEYDLGSQAPIEHVRKALALGRLSILYALHQMEIGERSAAVATLAGGMRFSHDVAAGGPLIAALAAKSLIAAHLRALNTAARKQPFSASEKPILSAALARIGPSGVDWGAATRREFEVIARSQRSVPASLEALYRGALEDAGKLPQLQQAIAGAPQSITRRIPNPQRVLDQKRELDGLLRQTRAALGL